MRRLAGLAVLATVAAALPALATATPDPLRTLTLRSDRAVPVAADVLLAGLRWTGDGPAPKVRWDAGAWEEPETSTHGGVTSTEPLWRPAGARTLAVDLPAGGAPVELVTVRADEQPDAAAAVGTPHPTLGTVGRRADWGADESLRRGRPSYAARVSAVVVHHTAQRNDYAPEDVPALIRADHAYHVRARGWDDLGYNLLVDRFGRIWEGRAGGLERAVVGTHAQGFNTGTLGVAVLGDYTQTTATRPVLRALARVGAHAARTWAFDPEGRVTLRSKGSPRYRSGALARLPRVFAHRDTSTTACPGSLADTLPDVRRGAATLLQPRPEVGDVTAVRADSGLPRTVTVDGRLTRPAPWEVTVTDAASEVLARATGTDAAPRVVWDGRRPVLGTGVRVPVLAGDVTWRVVVDDTWHDPDERTGTV